MTLIYFIIILGITVFIHELGHFIFAKKAGIYIYEFSLGMGPKLHSWHRPNDETAYSIRLLPLGGFVQLAGEDVDEDKSIPKEKTLQSKTVFQRFKTMVAGVSFNFLLALLIFFIVGLINGNVNHQPLIGEVFEDSGALKAGLQVGDEITSVNGKSINNVDKLLLELTINRNDVIDIKYKRNGEEHSTKLETQKEEQNGATVRKCGFSVNQDIKRGFFEAIKYSFYKFYSLVEQMILTLKYLFTGKLALKNLSGPVGIYNIVGESAKAGFTSLLFLTGYLSLNVGFINLLPVPAFDGGRILFLIIEMIKGKPLDPKVENTIHTIGFFLLMLLMVVITFNDITNLIK